MVRKVNRPQDMSQNRAVRPSVLAGVLAQRDASEVLLERARIDIRRQQDLIAALRSQVEWLEEQLALARAYRP